MIGKKFLTGGHAIFTVSNPAGEYHTYKVSAPADQNESNPIWFVSKLIGPNNTDDYAYLGILTSKGEVRWTDKSKFVPNSQAFKVAKWAIERTFREDARPLAEGYKISHIGKCGVCGRPLTTPESIECGIGPICLEKL